MSRFQRSMFAMFALALMPMAFANAQQVSVTAADPPAAVQGTVSLDVTVTGSGFNSTASVKFLVTGTADTGGITVKKVIVSSAKKLIATIDVADTAIVNKFDVEVALSSGRKGKGTTLFTVQAKSTGKPAPIPQPTPTSCTGATGVYPAVAYTKDRRHLKGRTSVYDGTDIYIGTSTGSCSSIVWSLPYLSYLTYRQLGTLARIVWIDETAVWLLKFHVENGNIVDPLPLSASLVYTPPTGSVNDVELSPDGQTIYFTDEVLTSDSRWLSTAKSIDISSCSSSCAPQTIYTFPLDNSVAGLSVNSANDRLYMRIHDRVPDIRTISFLQKQNGIWSSLRHVVSNRDAAYATLIGFHATDFGRWDYTNSGVSQDVVAYVVQRPSGYTIDIIDVSNCAASGSQSCFGSGESSVIRTAITGTRASFTSTPASSDPAPNLLVQTGT